MCFNILQRYSFFDESGFVILKINNSADLSRYALLACQKVIHMRHFDICCFIQEVI